VAAQLHAAQLLREKIAMHGKYVGLRRGVTNPLARWALYWDDTDGGEGGGIDLCFDQHALALRVNDYDGAFSMPEHVRGELSRLGVKV
jgi:hypothetical protein